MGISGDSPLQNFRWRGGDEAAYIPQEFKKYLQCEKADLHAWADT